MPLGYTLLGPRSPHCGHSCVKMQTTKNSWSTRFWILMLRVGGLQYTSSWKIKFQFEVVQLSKYLWKKCKNIANPWKYNKYIQKQHMYYAVFLLFESSLSCFFFWDHVLLFMFDKCMYFHLDQCTNSFHILLFKFLS